MGQVALALLQGIFVWGPVVVPEDANIVAQVRCCDGELFDFTFIGPVCGCSACGESNCPCWQARIRCSNLCHTGCANHESGLGLSAEKLVVGPSRIGPNSGDGVFAATRIAAGTRICGESFQENEIDVQGMLVFPVTFGRESVPLELLRDVVERASPISAAKSLLHPRQWVSTAVFLDFGRMLESQFPDLSVGSSFGFPSPSTKLHHFHRIVFTRPLLLFPVVESGHWTLLRVVIHGGNQFRVTLFDPYGQSPSSFEDLEVAFGDYFRRCIVDEKFRLKSRTLFSVADWRNVLGSMSFALVHARVPRQEDGQTCGLRALFYMELMAKNPDERSVDELTHDNSPDFWDLYRKWILYSLYCQATKQ